MTIPFFIDYDARGIVINAASLPGAPAGYTQIEYEGDILYAYSFTVGNAQALRAVGVDVPSPIRTGYRWPKIDNRYSPRELQLATSEFLTLSPRAYVLNQIGTGKTAAALWAADYLMGDRDHDRYLRRCLIVSPLSTLSPVWADTILKTFPHRSFAVLHGTAEKRRHMFATNKDFYIVNHDGLDILTKNTYNDKGMLVSARLMRDDIDLFIFDEFAVYRHSNIARWNHIAKVLQDFPDAWAWGMTGLPTPNSPADAYGQVKLLTPERVPKYFGSFRNLVMKQESEFRWEPRPEAVDVVHTAMQPAICFMRKGNIDIADTVYTPREVDLTIDQKKHYKQMLNTFVTEFKTGQIVTAVNEGVQMSKLLQIACGSVYDKDGATVDIDERGAKPRLKVVLEIMDEVDEKVIIFAQYTSIVKYIHRNLMKHSPGAMVIGNVSKGERDRIFRDFQQKHTPRWIVADPRTMSHGLTLTEASTIIWFGPTTSNDIYTQANGRIERDGQTGVPNIINVYATALEKKLYKRLEERTAANGLLLEMVRSGAQI